MSKTDTVSPLRQRMIEDMAARKLDPHTQRGHLSSCERFTTWLRRSPDTATADEVRLFQLHLVESGASICNRNRIMTGVRFLFRVTLRRHDLAAEIWHMKEPQKLPPVLSPEEIKRVLTMATSLKARAMLSLAYGCGLRASEVARLRVCDIDSEQMIIRVVQSKGRKDRNVMLPPEILDLLRQWWKARPKRRDAGVRAGTTLVVSRSRRSSDDAPVRPAVQGRGESRGAAQGGLPSFAASFLRNPSARGRQGHSADSGVARTREARHDGALHPRGDGTHRQGREPARAPDHAAPQAGDAKRSGSRRRDSAAGHGSARSGARGHPPRARSRLARGQPRPREPRPVEGDERNRALPHGGARRPRRTLRERGVRPYARRFQLVPATGIARSARPRRRADGWPTAKRSCCPSRTFTSCTRCRASCATSPSRTSAWSTTS